MKHLPVNSNGVTNCAWGIFKLTLMHPISEMLAENDRREVAKLDEDNSKEDEDDILLTPEQLEEKRLVK